MYNLSHSEKAQRVAVNVFVTQRLQLLTADVLQAYLSHSS